MIFGEQGNKPIYFRGTREKVVPPPPPGRASLMEDQARGGGGGDSIPARGLGLAENDGFYMA